jgi:mycothiol synthase
VTPYPRRVLTEATGDHAWTEVLEVVRAACRDADGQDPLDEAARLRLKHHGLTGSRLWLAGDAGFALAHGGGVDLAVAPASRRRGVGGELATAAFAGEGPATAWSHGDHPAARVLADRHGLRRARELWVMRLGADTTLPELVVPEGLTIRGYRPQDEDEVLRVNAAAFAHHPEQGSMDAADLADRMAEDWYDPAGLLVADTGSGLSGFHWTKRHDSRLGEVYVVGVDPSAQGQGLGTVLTLAGLHHLRDAGLSEVLLYVESDNAPAVRVYSGLGFTHAEKDTHVQYRRP